MLLFFVLFFLFLIATSGITTIPSSVAFLAVSTVVFKKSWVFFVALGLGLLLDLVNLRPLGYTGLIFAIFVLVIWLYERKFETRTLTFIFIATFLGSLVYLKIFGHNQILVQSIASSLIAILLFKILYFGKLRKLSESD